MEDQELIDHYNAAEGDDYIANIYQDDVPLVETSVGISGGDEKTKYYVGFSTFDQDGVIKGQGYNRTSFRVTLIEDYLTGLL
jgi:hypothetical protein